MEEFTACKQAETFLEKFLKSPSADGEILSVLQTGDAPSTVWKE